MLPVATSILSEVFSVAVIVGLVALAIYSYYQKLCPHCGEHKSNQWKNTFPVCKKCGRDRRVVSAAPSEKVQRAQEFEQLAPRGPTRGCPECGQTISAATRICRYCGFKFE